jgi:hypothetical protein
VMTSAPPFRSVLKDLRLLPRDRGDEVSDINVDDGGPNRWATGWRLEAKRVLAASGEGTAASRQLRSKVVMDTAPTEGAGWANRGSRRASAEARPLTLQSALAAGAPKDRAAKP